jgi:hypothetical protein
MVPPVPDVTPPEPETVPPVLDGAPVAPPAAVPDPPEPVDAGTPAVPPVPVVEEFSLPHANEHAAAQSKTGNARTEEKCPVEWPQVLRPFIVRRIFMALLPVRSKARTYSRNRRRFRDAQVALRRIESDLSRKLRVREGVDTSGDGERFAAR